MMGMSDDEQASQVCQFSSHDTDFIFMISSRIVFTHFSQFQGLRFPLTHLAALKQLLSSERVAVGDLQLMQDADKLGLTLGLWTEGLLRVC